MKKNKVIIPLVLVFAVVSIVLMFQFMKPEGTELDNGISVSQPAVDMSVSSSDEVTPEGKNPTSSSESQGGNERTSSPAQQEVFDGTAPIIRNMNETLYIDALPPRKQGEKPPTRKEVFALWQGEISVKVTRAALYDSLEESNLPEEDIGVQDMQRYMEDANVKVLVVDLQMKNISAVSNNYEADNRFYADMFALSGESSFSLENFNTEDINLFGERFPFLYTSQPSEGDAYFSFYVDQGTTQELTIAAIVYPELIPLDEMILEIETTGPGAQHFFGIRLNEIEGM